MSTKNPKKIPQLFLCKLCDYSTSNCKDYKKHLSTSKHQLATKSTEKSQKNATCFCDCGKKYKDRSGLWRHKKKCEYIREQTMSISSIDKNVVDSTELGIGLAKQFAPLLKDMLVDIIPVLQPHHTDNSNNLNINMFLNEQCKDAMNMSDFIESIQLSLEDMKYFGDKGQTMGMTNILVDKLNALDKFKRPMHCSDIKKETIYIKDEDKWEMEEKNKPNIRHALDKLTKKGLEAMPCMQNNPDEYVKTISEVLKDPREDKKIISKVAKEIII
jgi:hypothetical protein